MTRVFLTGPDWPDDICALITGMATARPQPATLDGTAEQGWLLTGMDDGALSRLAFYAAASGGGLSEGRVGDAPVPVLHPGPVDLPFAERLALADEIMALRGIADPAAIRARLPQMAVRASSRLRARAPAPATLRHATVPGDVTVTALRQPYAHFFAVEESDLSFRRFDGTQVPVITRAAFISGDAVTVLPYDPVRDRVLLIEQFRAGPLARGDSELWQLEAIAGRIDAGETPEQAARREAVEEAGLVLAGLIPIARYYPSPGAVSEYIWSYLALADLPDETAGVFGVAEEAEDIRGHLIGFADLMALVASGEIDNAPLILTALWLQRERPRLRGKG